MAVSCRREGGRPSTSRGQWTLALASFETLLPWIGAVACGGFNDDFFGLGLVAMVSVAAAAVSTTTFFRLGSVCGMQYVFFLGKAEVEVLVFFYLESALCCLHCSMPPGMDCHTARAWS